MAAILRAPSGSSKGIVTFTTRERDRFIRSFPDVAASVSALRRRWVIGLHHNWHDYNYRPDPLFDFNLAGEGDLLSGEGTPLTLIPFDACNFVPDVFSPATAPKFWDILYVARAVAFKNIPEFFGAIRTLYDAGQMLRVLFICPVPPFVKSDVGNAIYDVREKYNEMFTGEERGLFTLLTLDFDYPFPFDLPTLAHFYASSKVFVHSAADERRCRVAAYAWASGLPVVAMESVGSILPQALRKPPLFYEARTYADFPAKILEALSGLSGSSEAGKARGVVSSSETENSFRRALENLAGPADLSRYALKQLDVRLGRHHELNAGLNRVMQTFRDFVGFLSGESDNGLLSVVSAEDPEKQIAELRKDSWVEPPAERDSPMFFRRLTELLKAPLRPIVRRLRRAP
jgi:glycosyltransferase involved in cell wall biosynthesis